LTGTLVCNKLDLLVTWHKSSSATLQGFYTATITLDHLNGTAGNRIPWTGTGISMTVILAATP
jgi:hypothetical protein